MAIFQQLRRWLIKPPTLPGVLTSVQTSRAIHREMARTDRTGIAFSVVTLLANFDTPSGSRLFEALIEFAQQRLRLTDDIGHLQRDVVALLLPITDRNGADVVANEFEERFGDEVRIDVYTYPTEWFIESLHQDTESFESAGGLRSRQEAMEAMMARATPLPAWKRSLDVLGATVGLLVFSPLMLIFAALIKSTSRGPVFFSQKRSGLGGAPFDIYKFRTMVIDAEQRQDELRDQSEQDGPAFKLTDDPRVTWIGKYLRKSCIDELPQLINILKGEMSLVGPRPLPVHESLACTAWQRARLTVLPGLTCTWQAYGGRDVKFAKWMEMDLEYIERQGLFYDAKLIADTVVLAVLHKGSV